MVIVGKKVAQRIRTKYGFSFFCHHAQRNFDKFGRATRLQNQDMPVSTLKHIHTRGDFYFCFLFDPKQILSSYMNSYICSYFYSQHTYVRLACIFSCSGFLKSSWFLRYLDLDILMYQSHWKIRINTPSAAGPSGTLGGKKYIIEKIEKESRLVGLVGRFVFFLFLPSVLFPLAVFIYWPS